MLTVFVQVLGLAVVVTSIVRSGERAQVLMYAFILEYSLRLLTVYTIMRVLRKKPAGRLARAASLMCSPPTADQSSHPMTHGDSGRAAGPGGYLFVLAYLAFLAFVLGNVNADRELDLDRATFLHDMRWAVALALFYGIQSLASRSVIIDPTATRETNVGYNSRDLAILALATLTSGVVVVIRQMLGLPASGWAVLGPLLAFRFLYDVTTALQAVRRRRGVVL